MAMTSMSRNYSSRLRSAAPAPSGGVFGTGGLRPASGGSTPQAPGTPFGGGGMGLSPAVMSRIAGGGRMPMMPSGGVMGPGVSTILGGGGGGTGGGAPTGGYMPPGMPAGMPTGGASGGYVPGGTPVGSAGLYGTPAGPTPITPGLGQVNPGGFPGVPGSTGTNPFGFPDFGGLTKKQRKGMNKWMKRAGMNLPPWLQDPTMFREAIFRKSRALAIGTSKSLPHLGGVSRNSRAGRLP